MKRPFRLLALCVPGTFAFSLCAIRCAAEAMEASSSVPVSPPAGGPGAEFPYLLGVGVLLGMFVAVRLRRKAERDPTRRR